MKSLLLAVILLVGGEQERGLKLYAVGDYAGAATAFRAALAEDPNNAEIAYNLALASWRAGEFEAAETAAERAATLSDGTLSHLRDGLLGNLRYAAAEAKQEEDLQAALELAQRARSNFLRGALTPGSGPELRRNLERANLLIDDLNEKIEAQKKQDEDQEDQEDQENQEDQGDKQDNKQDDQDSKDPDKQEDDPDQGDQKDSDPKQGEEPEPELEPNPNKDDESQPESEPDPDPDPEPESPPQSEPATRSLSAEQLRRLLESLEELEEQKQKLRAQLRVQRPKVKKDW